MKKELKLRLDKIRNLSDKCDAIIIPYVYSLPNPNYVWLTNCTATGTFYWDFSKPHIWTSNMEAPLVKKDWIKPTILRNSTRVELKRKVVGVDKSTTPAAVIDRIKKKAKRVVDVGSDIAKAREIKTKYEALQTKKACDITRKLFSKLPLRGTEASIRAHYDHSVLKQGLKPSFDTIVASGANIATPHHIATMKKAKKPILIDAGVRYNNYNSDVTRTWGSRFEKLTLKVFEEVEPMLKPGAKCSEIDKAARRVLGKHQKFFITALGHGIGVAVHEDPLISTGSSHVLKEGMIFTIEPGIYVPGGIRIENMYYLRKDGAEKLTDW